MVLRSFNEFNYEAEMVISNYDNVFIGPGALDNKGVYANKNFNKGEIVIKYNLKLLSKDNYNNLNTKEKMFTHIHAGKIYLYSDPERYVNHSEDPNTYQDLIFNADIALREIKYGEMITTNANKDDVSTFEELLITNYDL